MSKDQMWVRTLPHISLNAADALHSVCQPSQMEPMQMSEGKTWSEHQSPQGSPSYNEHASALGRTPHLELCEIPSGEQNGSLQDAGFSQRKPPSTHEPAFSSCPYFTPLTSPIVAFPGNRALQRGNACCITLASLLPSLCRPRGVLSAISPLGHGS